MKRVSHGWIHALSIIFAAVPFVFALVRAVRTGSDLRYFWLASASLIGAMATMAAGRSVSANAKTNVLLSVGVFIVATLLAVLAAVLIGTRLGPGVLVVGSAFGLCLALASLFHMSAGSRSAD